jgi:hypothetical protein
MRKNHLSLAPPQIAFEFTLKNEGMKTSEGKHNNGINKNNNSNNNKEQWQQQQ